MVNSPSFSLTKPYAQSMSRTPKPQSLLTARSTNSILTKSHRTDSVSLTFSAGVTLADQIKNAETDCRAYQIPPEEIDRIKRDAEADYRSKFSVRVTEKDVKRAQLNALNEAIRKQEDTLKAAKQARLESQRADREMNVVVSDFNAAIKKWHEGNGCLAEDAPKLLAHTPEEVLAICSKSNPFSAYRADERTPRSVDRWAHTQPGQVWTAIAKKDADIVPPKK